MKRVYVLTPGTYLRKRGDNLCLIQEGKVVDEVGFHNLTQLILIGYISLSGAVLNSLVVHRVETVLLDGKGRFKGRLCVEEHKHVQRRMNQYLKLNAPLFSLKTAQRIVKGKLLNQARFLALRSNKSNREKISNYLAAIKALSKTVEQTTDLDVVRGIEGHASRLYFQAFGHLIANKEFSFLGRNKRPPLDPVNALLSFVYTLLTNEVLTAIKIVGLDPYLGALHAIEYGRPSLACDLVEEWRTVLGDRLVLTLINRKIVKKEDFTYRQIESVGFIDETELKNKRPVQMKPAICKVFLEAYENFIQSKVKYYPEEEMTSYRNAILKQVEAFKTYLLEGKDYEPINLNYLS